MLQATDIRFRYHSGGPWVLDGVTLELGRGEIVGLRGPSGDGKTTLAKILAGYLRPASGRVLLDGKPPVERGYCAVQLMFQHPELTLNPHLRVAAALQEAGDEGPKLAEALGLRPSWLSRFPHELSGGELQRIALARALGTKTRYLIADEMTAMLDAVAQAEIWRLLLCIVEERGLGLLAVSHEDALLARVSHRIVELRPQIRRTASD